MDRQAYLLHFQKEKVEINYATPFQAERQFKSRGGDLMFIDSYTSVAEAAYAQNAIEAQYNWSQNREIVLLYAPRLDHERTHLRYFTHLADKTEFLEKDEILECKRSYPNISF